MEPKPAGKIAVGHPVDVASGTLFHEFDDFTLPGRVPLIFKRRYSTALIAKRDGMFGQGWSSPCEMSLIRDIDGCRLIGEDGEAEIVFNDHEAVLESGGVLYNFGAFHDLRLQGEHFIVTRWTPDGDDVVRFVFKANDDQLCPLVSRTDVEGQGTDIHRDGQGRVVLLRQRRERRALKLVYSPTGRVIEVHVFSQDRERTVLRYSYDRNDRLSEMTGPLGHRCQYEYDDDGRMTREMTIGGLEFRFSYDSEGRCVATSGQADFDLHSLEYFDAARVTQVKNSLGHITSYYWNQSGQVEKEISPLGNTKLTGYDEFGRIIELISPGGSTTAYQYDERGNRTRIILPTGAMIGSDYDENHQVTAVIDSAGYRWENRFDPLGHLIEARDPLGNTWSYSYSQQGDLSTITNPLGFSQTRTCDASGNLTRVTDWLGHPTLYEHNDHGHVTAMIDPLGHRTEASIDALGRIAQLKHPDGTSCQYDWNVFDQIIRYQDELGAVTRLDYTVSGLVYRITRPNGGQVRFQYKSVPGQLTSIINENGERHLYEYDADGRMIRETDIAGRVTRYEYDMSGRVAAIENAAGHRTKLERDANGALLKAAFDDGSAITYEYDSRGYLTKADNGDCPVGREYDAAGRLIVETQGEQTVVSEYDAAGNRIRRRSSLGRETGFAWDGNGLVTAIRTGTFDPIHFEYDARQNEVSRFIPDGVRINQFFDDRGRSVEQWTGNSRRPGAVGVGLNSARGIHRRYAYDAASNLTDTLDARWGPTRYVYDLAGRVVLAEHQNSFTEHFAYDAADNFTKVDRLVGAAARLGLPGDGGTPGWQYAKGYSLVQRNGATYVYDGLGQLVRKKDSKGETAYEWNRSGQLRKVTLPGVKEWIYEYDAFDRRVKKSGPSREISFVWDGDVILHESHSSDEDDVLITDWEFDRDGFAPIAMITKGKRYCCVNDPVGTPRELADSNGDVAWAADFAAFGEARVQGLLEVGCPVRYPGQYYDGETGLHYNRHRYYDPETGRFISPDPIGLAGGLNLYAYAPNTSGWIDPLGLTVRCPKKMPKRLKDEADRFQRRAQKSGEKAACVIYDAKTNQVYTGLSGGPYPREQSKGMPQLLKDSWLHGRDPQHCAEYKALNAALLAGADRQDLHVFTFNPSTGIPMPRCGNCQRSVAGVAKIWSD